MAVYTASPSSESDSNNSNAGDLRFGRQRLSSGLDSAVSFTGSSAAGNKIQKNRSARSPTTNRSHRSHSLLEEEARSNQGGNEQNQTEQQEEEHQEEEMEDDIMFLCRCENPKLLVEILQSFSKTGLSSSSSHQRKSFTTSTTQGSSAVNITQTQRRSTVVLPTQPMTIFCSANAMTIHSQSSNKQFQASMELPCTFFQHYQLAQHPNHNDQQEDDKENTETDTFDFTIHWHTFLQCLTVLLTTANSSAVPFVGGSNNYNNNSTSSTIISSTLTMAYHTSTELLRLEWETFHQHNHHQSIMATAAIPGLETPEAEEAAELSAAFQQSPIAARWLSTSTCLKEAKTELELVPGATLVQVEFWQEQPNKSNNHLGTTTKLQPCLRLLTKGYSSQVTVEIPGSIEFSNPSDTLYYSQQPRKPHKLIHTYTLAHWRQALQPLDMAKETCISVNQQGILAVQHSLTVHRGNTSRNLDEDDDDGTLAVFCDFLLLPMVEQLQEDYDDENDKQSTDDDDDHNDSYTESSGLKTQSSHNNRHGTDDEATTQSYPARHRSTSRTNRNDDDDDDDDDRRSASLPIGSDDDDDEDERNEQPVLKRSAMLFPSLTGAVHDTPHSTLTQETMESSVLRHQRRRDQRKRHRRASNERQQPQQQQHRLATHQESQQHAQDDDDDDDDSGSVNLLQDSPPSHAPQKQQPHFYSSDENDRDEEDRHYCSSPEIVYGES
ncbi:repair protein rad1/Rec1/rad17 [Nitzschia inconspicua]|uniref:Repair protein rad1/Rec1/rad17 n=1 Tax=Nitzschia inconspicua TaxID=303405 RepID=A0A9K3LXT7_9STRA|nr:repair protein rad1/Rec1/rad17 [Nitzschia inconspicua]